ncbi:MAG: PAS domain-containing protein [Gemmatimonadaceae bacterium]|nr:PAS domain-containing protein [Gemmatimonadaceae bacterium]
MSAPRDETAPEAQASAVLTELGDVLEVGIIILDRELVVRGWNHWFAVASGIEPAAALGRSVLDIFPDLKNGQAEAALRRALDGATVVWSQQFHGFLFPLDPPAGHERFARMQQSARLMPWVRDGRNDGVIALVQDVTERVAREDDLRHALDRAEVASQAKSEFLASMSHELRTPLAAIVGYMDLLEGEMVGPVEPLQKDYLARVKTAARHLISIIEEILTFSRVEAGKDTLFIESVNATDLTREVESLFEPQARAKSLALELELPPEPIVLRTDATKLKQILINLLGNALKFTDAGSVSLAVSQSGARVSFVVSDTGPGIIVADRERVFDAFTQLDQSHRRRKGGTGLGLPVSRKLAHLLGGDLLVDEAVGGGARFTLTLPAGVPAAPYAGAGGVPQNAVN